ncbi:MAG: hypothetical protein M3O50_08870 [Myxococcota bacterium]|nr:hypothetical protein [Myxococcota bacterium]
MNKASFQVQRATFSASGVSLPIGSATSVVCNVPFPARRVSLPVENVSVSVVGAPLSLVLVAFLVGKASLRNNNDSFQVCEATRPANNDSFLVREATRCTGGGRRALRREALGDDLGALCLMNGEGRAFLLRRSAIFRAKVYRHPTRTAHEATAIGMVLRLVAGAELREA